MKEGETAEKAFEALMKQRSLVMWRLFDMGVRKSKIAYVFDASIETVERALREKREAGEPYGRQGF